tara:strand:- start:17341 stop:18981 length:1641 start_codon:yes stop_codon:yes gene_type:complete
MNNRKKRVLVLSESHHLASGFGTYGKEVISRLVATGKYDIAEFACFGHPAHAHPVPWDYYGNMPMNQEEEKQYNTSPINSFGYWKFDLTCLHFKPDIVISYRDPWMDKWLSLHPYRDYFHWAWMPTVDSAPQRREWLDIFESCDAIFTYSEFGTKTLSEQTGGKINVIGCASPGIDPNLFKPVEDKKKLRAELGLPEDCFIVGTVMRNQKRKLFIELIKSFRMFLDNAPKEIAEKTYLYLHTSYPEKSGWDIGGALVEMGVASRTFVTYCCRNCGEWFPTKFRDAITTCKYCGARSAYMPHVSHGLDVPDLIKVYNLFDIYVQYAICEGFGMPQVEAAACGVPVAAPNYSAMEDVVKHTKGMPIDIACKFREMDTGADRIYPCNKHLAKILEDFFSSSEDERAKKSAQVREGAIKRYNWDDTAKVWEDYLDSYTPINLQGKWDSPPRFKTPVEQIPDLPNNTDLTRWLLANVEQREDKVFSKHSADFSAALNFGAILQAGLEPMDREKLINIAKSNAMAYNKAEDIRVSNAEIPVPNFYRKAEVNK